MGDRGTGMDGGVGPKLWLGLATLLACVGIAAFPASSPAGTIVAASGFLPDPDGFSFENYGNEEGYANLDADGMRRIFGGGVCLGGGSSSCVLTPTARAWMDSKNAGMEGGHCYGMAVLSQLIHEGLLPRFGYSSLAAFGDSALPYGLDLGASRRLQRSIARAYAFQSLESVSDHMVKQSPRAVLDALIKGLRPADRSVLTLGIYQRGFEGGHEITPYAVEDMGGGRYDVLVYDNNWPGQTGRRLHIDTASNTWSYYASTNPGNPEAMYEGDAESETLELSANRPALGTQPCPFCIGRRGLKSKYNEITLDGTAATHAHLLITDRRGRRTGFVGGRFVNRIPGVEVVPRTSGGVAGAGSEAYADSLEPTYRVPKKVRFEVKIDGSRLKTTDRETLTLVGPTYDATVERIAMAPGRIARLGLAPGGKALIYRSTGKTRKPTVSFGASAKQAAYKISVKQLGGKAHARMIFVKRPKYRLMWVGDLTRRMRRYRIVVRRYTKAGLSISARAFRIRGRQQAFLYYGPLARPDGAARIVIYRPGRKKLREFELRPVSRGSESR